ncbi:MAG: hypothetical protein JJ895_02950 [Balneolaceae bacterium]|nr:hypothetical protein [Balneolaceae bacterium]
MASILIGRFGFNNAEVIEDVIQDTFYTALRLWGMKGIPENPEAWLMKVATNKTINELKKRGRHKELNKQFVPAFSEESEIVGAIDHQEKAIQLKALFGCCSPLLGVKAQIMLTLKLVCGFGDKEIASAFFMGSAAVRKAIYRSKITLKEHQNYFLELTDKDLQQRLPIVEMVLYLMFNEGYSTTNGEQEINADLCFEAMRLTEWIIDDKVLCNASTHALFALMLFQFARFEARVDAKGTPISIEDQNRELWHKELIHRGLTHQKLSRKTDTLSRFHIESGIASIHCTASTYADTDWERIIDLYHHLLSFDDSIQVETGLAIALCEHGEVDKSLILLKKLESKSSNQFSVLFAALGRVHTKIGELEKAKSYYTVAIEYSKTRFERAYLEEKLANLTLKSMPR